LRNAGADVGDVVRTTMYVALSEQCDVLAASEVVRDALSPHDPPSTLLGVTVLGYDHRLVEIDAVAALPAQITPPTRGGSQRPMVDPCWTASCGAKGVRRERNTAAGEQQDGPVIRPLAPRRFSCAASVLIACLASGALSWVALTTGVLPVSFALACVGGVICAAVVVVARGSKGRLLALLGVPAVALPIVRVALVQLASDG
jgi:hypothetical protein